ncbi:MAG: T9SS type A sorting domain-containing protein [Bacteroidota bacterium]
MKLRYFIYSIFILTSFLKAQEYPTMTIPELNIVPDSILANASTISEIGTQYSGDTVKIVGTVLFAPMVDWENDRRLTTSSATRGSYLTFIQDTSGALWGGMTVEQPDTNFATGFDIIDTGDVVEMIGIVSEGFYGNTTTLSILVEPLTEINIVDSKGKRPDPIVVTVSEFFDETSFNLEAEKYEGMFVEFQNVITSDRNPGGSTNFAFSDGSGNKIFMYDQSSYFTERSGHKLVGITEYESPANGTLLKHIRGIIHTRDDGWYIVPLYPGDMKIGETAPPTITLIQNAPPRVLTNQSADVLFKIEDNDGTVTEAKIIYQVNDGEFLEIPMTFQDTAYSANIPGTSSDNSLVSYYVYAKDNEGNESISPNDTSVKYYYWVLNSDPTIFHVQYTPYRQGASRFEGEVLTLQGVITADSSDIDEQGGSAQYMQMRNSFEWAGLRMIKVPLNGQVRGDLVSVTGTVIEDYYHTTIDVSNLEILEHVGEIPSLILTCDQISTGRNDAAEEYESMLIVYKNLIVTNENADGTSNYGEILVSDALGSTRVELQDGSHSYHNNWEPGLADSAGLIGIKEGNTFESITGVIYYAFNNFKLIPRKNDDFWGFTDIEENVKIPAAFELSQNYPNPFNPTTVIQYSVPEMVNVKLKVYDMLGREISTLVNREQSAGIYKVEFNAANLSSGVYFYRIEAGNFVVSKKLLLLK